MNPIKALLTKVQPRTATLAKGLAVALAIVLAAAAVPLAGFHPLEGNPFTTSDVAGDDGGAPSSHAGSDGGSDDGDVNQSADQDHDASADQEADGDANQSAYQGNIQVVDQDANGSANQSADQESNQTIRQDASGDADQDASQENEQSVDQDAAGGAEQEASQDNEQTIEQEAGGDDGSDSDGGGSEQEAEGDAEQDAEQSNDQEANQTAYGSSHQSSDQSNDQCIDQDAEGDAEQDAGQSNEQSSDQEAQGDNIDQSASQDSEQTADQDANTEDEDDPCAPDDEEEPGDEEPPAEGDAEIGLHKAVRATDGGAYGPEATVEPGEEVAFRLNATNTGNATAHNVTIVDAVPENTTFVSCSDTCQRDGDLVAWDLGNLTPGAWTRVTFVVEVEPTVDNGTTIPNTGFVDSEDEDPVESNQVLVHVNTEPALDATKAVRNLNRTDSEYGVETTAEPGEHVRFRVNVTNTGTAPAENVTVEDSVLPHTEFVSCAPETACNHTAGEITWSFGTLDAGATVSAFLTLKVSSRAPNGTTLNNTALADANGTEPVETNVVQVHIQEAGFGPGGGLDDVNATLEKEARDSGEGEGFSTHVNASAGDEVQYRLTFTNTGNATLTNVTVREEVPERSEFLTCSDACQREDENVTWALGTVEPGDSHTVSFVVELDEAFENEQNTIENVAGAGSDQGYWTSNEVTVTVVCSPDSELRKEVRNLERDEAYTTNTTAEPGDRVRYRLTYTNEGNATADDVVLRDTVPENTTLVSTTGDPTVEDGRNLTWELGDRWPTRCDCAHPVTVTFTVELDENFSGDTTIPNRATVESEDEAPEYSNWANVTVLVPEGEPVLEPQGQLDKDVRNLNATQSTYGDNVTAEPGAHVRFRLNYTNAGNATARNVTVNDTVLPHSSFVSCSDACNHTAGEILWTLGNVTPDATVNVTFTLKVSERTPNGTVLNNTGYANASNHPVVESDQVTVTVEEEAFGPGGEPVVMSALDKDVRNLNLTDDGFGNSTTAAAGDHVRFRINYTNWGAADASDVTIVDAVPELASLVACPECTSVDDGNLTWDLGNVNNATVNFTVELDATFPNGVTNVTNVANVTTAEEDQPTESDEVTVTVQASPDPVLDKDVRNLNATDDDFGNHTTAEPGDRVRYRLTYRNEGNATARNVTVVDAVPENTTFVSASDDVQPTEAGNLTWLVGDVSVGAEATVNFTVRVNASVDDGTVIPNVGGADSPDHAYIMSDWANVTVQVPQEGEPVSHLVKEVRNEDADGEFVQETTAAPGDVLAFRLTYENQGTAPASNVTVVDEVPANTTLLTCQDPCIEENGTLTWNLGSVDANASEDVRFRVRIHENTTEGDLVTNVANVTTDTTNDTSNQVTVTVRTAPALTVEKAVDRLADKAGYVQHTTARPGDLLRYHLTARNQGTAPVHNVTLTDPVIPRSTLLNSTHNFTRDNGTLTWDLGTLNASEEVQVRFNVALDGTFPNGTTVLENVATITSNSTASFESENVTVSVEAHPDLDVTKGARPADSDQPFVTTLQTEPGAEVTYRLTLENTGGANATNVTLKDEVPDHATLLDCGNCTEENGTLTWSLDPVEPGTVHRVTFTVELDDVFPAGTTLIDNVAVADAQEVPPTESNEVTLEVEAGPSSHLAKAVRNLDGPDDTFGNRTTAEPSDQVRYRLTYANNGTANATEVTVTETVPEHTSFVNATDNATLQDGTLTWDLGTVEPGGTEPVEFTVELDESFDQRTTLVENIAKVDTAQEPLVESNEVVVNVTAATELDLEKTVANLDDGTSFQDAVNATPGDEVRYRLNVTNTGSTPSDEVTLLDTVPEDTTLVDTTGEPTVEDGTLNWTLASLDPNGTATVTFTVELDATFPAGNHTLPNLATLPDRDEKDDADVVVHAVPDLDLLKTSDVDDVRPGDDITYTITVWNEGNGTAQDATLTDTLPTGVELVNATPPAANQEGRVLTWNLDEVAAGTTQEDPALTINVTVNVTTNRVCTLTNTATLDSPLGDVATAEANVTLDPNFDRAVATGSAYGLDTTGNLAWGNPESTVSTFQRGLGPADTATDEVTGVTVEGVADVGVLRTTSRSNVMEDPDRSVATSTSTATDVSLLGGFIRADVVEAKVTATAYDDGALVRTAGSSFTNLTVNGVHMEDVAPNTRVELPASVFGDGSYVVLMETREAANASDAGTTGLEQAFVNVTMVHVHITDGSGTPFDVTGPVDIRLGQAQAAAAFPDAPNCAAEHGEELEGHALNTAVGTEAVSTADDPWNRTHGLVEVPEAGGVEEQTLHHVNVLNGDLTAGTWRTRAVATTGDPGGARVVTTHTVQDVCILPQDTGCLVGADTVRVTATARAGADANATTHEVNFVGLTVAGVPIEGEVDANTRIEVPGLANVTLNEVHHDPSGSNSVLVRAVHVELLEESSAGYTDLVLGEAMASAQWSADA